MLETTEFSISLLQCSFCGTVHVDEKSAERNGCLGGEPVKRFDVGDRVEANFNLVSGMEVVGAGIVNGIIVSINNPHDHIASSFPSCVRMGAHNENYIAFEAPNNRHDWICVVKPEKPKVDETFYFMEGAFYQSELKLAQ